MNPDQPKNAVRRVPVAISLLALSTLAVELLLTRIFDVILYPNLAYMIITAAMFSFGLAGIYSTLRPLPPQARIERLLARSSVALALSLLAIRPLLNNIPFHFEAIANQPVRQAIWFLAAYLVITVPFFLAGLIFARAFSSWADRIQSLYCWDLAGAALGCIVILPLLPALGPGGLISCAAGLIAVAAALFDGRRVAMVCAVLFAALCFIVPWLHMPSYMDFTEHKVDRGLALAREEGASELVFWDPISKIEVVDLGWLKNIVYDGGSQSSFLYPFGGNLDFLRQRIERGWSVNDNAIFRLNFWTRAVPLAHYLYRDREQQVLVIGSAAGQEVKAALAYGAGHVDAVEMVGAVVDLGKRRYAQFNGGIFNHPRVNAVRGEGRSFVRSSSRRYDVIQIFSNHSSSSVAAGAGALDPTYLLTADAFVEYFNHLADNGSIQINHHTYPRIITTAALAWRWMGRSSFRRHVVVATLTNPTADLSLPTVLIKMRPWTGSEMGAVRGFLSVNAKENAPFALAEDPLHARRSFLSLEFYSGEVSDELRDRVPYRITATTDDRPYFKFLRETWSEIEPAATTFVPTSVAHFLNQQVRKGGGVPMDVIHLYVTGFVSSVFVILFVVAPLLLSPIGRSRWPGWGASLVYFACLGGAFIVVELVLIQMLMHFVGYPLYTYSVVLFTVLLAAGLGSLVSGRLGIGPGSRRWWWPFAGILCMGGLFLLAHGSLIFALMALPTMGRVVTSAALVFPLAFFMGMPFPLGILAVQQHSRAAVAWAWGMNGLFTVIGGLASVLLSLYLGFRFGLVLALATYGLAWLSFAVVRRHVEPSA